MNCSIASTSRRYHGSSYDLIHTNGGIVFVYKRPATCEIHVDGPVTENNHHVTPAAMPTKRLRMKKLRESILPNKPREAIDIIAC